MKHGVNLFYSYAQNDESYREKLEKHLIVLKRQGVINDWHNRKIEAGVDWANEINNYLNQAQIILLLISADFIASEYCYEVEMKKALERHAAGQSTVIPIIVRPVDWEKTEFSMLKTLPSDGKPLSSWKNEDEALLDISRGIQSQVENIRRKLNSNNSSSEKDNNINFDINNFNYLSHTGLPSAIEKYDFLIDNILTCLKEANLTQKKTKINSLKAIETFFSADLVFISREKINFILEDERSNADYQPSILDRLNTELRSRYSSIWTNNKASCIKLQEDIMGRRIFHRISCIPAQISEDNTSEGIYENVVLIIIQSEETLEILDDLLGLVVKAILIRTYCFENFPKSSNELKSNIYDLVKRTYGYVSDHMYNTRFDLFKDDLGKVKMFFEPIISFDVFTKSIDIWGWEALARDSKTETTPTALFEAAELWGIQFQTELDLVCLENSLNTYRKVLDLISKKDSIGNFQIRKKDINPLTINIYPNTLLRDNYCEKIRQLLRKNEISGRKLVFEISEKTLLSDSCSDEGEKKRHINKFKKTMGSLRDELRVSFAIDDFGVGNSSIARLIELKPEYVKIDREIILSEKSIAKQIIKSINSIREDNRRVWEVIVEGYDAKSEISLDEIIIDAKVELVQGHKLLEGDFDLKPRLGSQDYHRIAQSLGWKSKDES